MAEILHVGPKQMRHAQQQQHLTTITVPLSFSLSLQAIEQKKRTLFAQAAKTGAGNSNSSSSGGSNAPQGMGDASFVPLVQELLDLPSCVAYVLFDKLSSECPVPPSSSSSTATATNDLDNHHPPVVTEDIFDRWTKANQIWNLTPAQRLWRVLVLHKKYGKSALSPDGVGQEGDDVVRKSPPDGVEYLEHEDLAPLVRAVINTHPGLEFLKDTPEFQDRYQETVVYRMFYEINRNETGKMGHKELVHSDLLEVLRVLDAEEDSNKVLRYFSYEHFYVIYCKYWELDTDHDFMIDKDALLRYSNHALTYRIVDRIFDQAPRPFKCPEPGKMGYEDFVWFILNEEDKSTDMSFKYWFKCIDLHGDGVITQDEAYWFWEEQIHRMENLMHEPVQFEDIICQLTDMIGPEREGLFTLRDLKKQRKQSGMLFNALVNINKFIAFENRDPFAARQQEQEAPQLSPWDRFAAAEYLQLAMDEETEGGDGGDDELL